MQDLIKEYGLLSGLGVVLVSAAGYMIKRFLFRSDGDSSKQLPDGPSITINNTNSPLSDAARSSSALHKSERSRVHILFIDDDTKFKVVKIIKSANWPNVSIKRDIRDLDAPDIRDTDIFFVDIQGVGKALDFADEGLGLARAIKKKFPDKKVVIYSAQTTGERFHPALNEADALLPKNAEPYEFIALLEQFFGV